MVLRMEKFLKKFQTDLENKMLACARGESIIKPFDQIYEEVREKKVKKSSKKKSDKNIYTKKEESIYAQAVQKFLDEHPEFIAKTD